MITLIKYAVCFAIIFAILLYIYGWVAESEREIAEEEAEEKYRREIENWKQTTQHPMVHIKVLDGDVRNSKAKTVNMTVNEFILRR